MTMYFASNKKIAETSSKGNQEKWRDGDHWYKLDQFGYEALAETLISTLLERSNIERDIPFKFTRYQIERIHAHGRERIGCSSANFLLPGQSIITLSHLLRRYDSRPLADTLSALPSDRQRIAYLAERTAEITGLSLFPQYLTLLFEVDALFLNDDRHLNNIAVLEQDGAYDYCPIFDNGAGLLSNTQAYPLDVAPRGLLSAPLARPLITTFNRQRNAARSLYGAQLDMPRFSRAELMDEVAPLLEYYPERDRALIADRVCEVVLVRQRG